MVNMEVVNMTLEHSYPKWNPEAAALQLLHHWSRYLLPLFPLLSSGDNTSFRVVKKLKLVKSRASTCCVVGTKYRVSAIPCH